jgi:hypothetical protein
MTHGVEGAGTRHWANYTHLVSTGYPVDARAEKEGLDVISV